MPDNRIKIILEAFDKTKDAFKGLGNSLEQAEAKTKSFTTTLKQHWLGISAAIAGAMITINKAWNLAEMAAQFEEQKASLNALAGQYNTTASQIISSVQEASRGLISMADAASVSAKALMMGMKPEQLVEFMRIVEATTNVTGMKVAESFERIIEAAAVGRERGLKQMGIIVDLGNAYKEYAAKVGKTVEELSEMERQQAGINAILSKGSEIINQLGQSIDSTSDKMERLRVTVKDIQLVMGTGLIRVSAGVIGIFQELASAALMVAAGFFRIGQAIGWLGSKTGITKEIREEMKTFAKEMGENAKAAWEASKDLAVKGIDNFTAMVSKSEDLAKAAGNIKKFGTEGVKPVSDEIKKLMKQFEDVKSKLSLRIETANYDEYQRKIAETRAEIFRLIEEYKKVPGAAEWLKEALPSLTAEIEYEERIEDEEELQELKKDALTQIEENKRREFELYEADIKYRLLSAEGIRDQIVLTKELLARNEDYLGKLDQYKDTSAWLAQAEAVENLKKKIKELNEKLKEQEGTALEGLIAGFRKYGKEVESIYKNMETAALNITKGMENAFMNFFDYTSEGFMKFGELVMDILHSIYKALMEALIIQPLVSAIAGGIGGLFTATPATPATPKVITVHQGGYIPRFHPGGLAYDEFPAILQKGEYVVSRRGMEALDRINQGELGQPNVNVVVNVQNNTGLPVQAKQGGLRFNGKQMIKEIILELKRTDPGFNQEMGRGY